MSINHINEAALIINRLAENKEIQSSVSVLKKELHSSSEQFVWKVIDEYLGEGDLGAEFKSAWIFLIRKNIPSEAHYHPNSTQYTAVIEGEGTCEINGVKSSLQKFNPMNPESIYVIEKSVPHEFFPGNSDLVVLSLHTVKADELIEINCSRGKERSYE